MFFHTIEEAEKFADRYHIPLVDVLMAGLNMMGTSTIGFDTSVTNRGRFKLTPQLSGWPYFFAVTIDQESPFLHDGKDVWLASQYIGPADRVSPDTCAETYIRKGGKALTLNSNSRSTCRGCKFCGTSSLVPLDFSNLLEEQNMRAAAQSFLDTGLVPSYVNMESIGVVTGCFRTDRDCLEHLLMIQRVFGGLGFSGEIRYIGSQINTLDAVNQLADAGKFALYNTVECFERRDNMMKRRKSSVHLDKHLEILGHAKKRGLQTNMLYILGLDSLEAIAEHFPRFLPVLTRHPLINLLQVYLPHHAALRDPAAQHLDYYLQARKIVEDVFASTFRPLGYDNYRSPWYSEYAGISIHNPI